MSRFRRAVFVVLIVVPLAVSLRADEQPRSARRSRSFIEQILIWVMDGLNSPPG